MVEISDVLKRTHAKFAAASRDEYPRTCGKCSAPLRLYQETFSDSGRLIDPVGRSACLPPHKGRHRAEPATGGTVAPHDQPTTEDGAR